MEAQERREELTRLLSELALPHPPLERFKVASRLWRLIAGFSREEQKRLLAEFGLPAATHLEQLAEAHRASMPKAFIEFIERGTRFMTPERIAAVVGALSPTAAEAVAQTSAPRNLPPIPRQSASSDDPSGSQEMAETASRRSAQSPAAPEDEPEPVASRKLDEVSSKRPEMSPIPGPAPGSPPPPPDLESETPSSDAHDASKVEEQEAFASQPPSAEPQSRTKSEMLLERCARLESVWKRRRFWLDVARAGFSQEEAGGILRAVSASGLTAQDYVWVVDEMAVRGLLPSELYELAVDLAPSGSAARLLDRRLPLLMGEHCG